MAFLVCRISNFNPRPPRGGRLILIARSFLQFTFQSTPSEGRATADYPSALDFIRISIHALRGEGDG